MARLYVVVTFNNVTEALKLEKASKNRGLAGRLIPTPRALSSSCALSWRAEPDLRAQLEEIIETDRIHVSDLREMEL